HDAIDAALAELERIEAMFSTFRAQSAISRINRGELELLDAPADVIEVLDACTWLEHASHGAFNVRRGNGSLDPAGFVKGWATQRASEVLVGRGIADFVFSVGGDLVVRGAPQPGGAWTIAIADPEASGVAACSVDLAGGAIATSGSSERGRHIRTIIGDDQQFASVSVLGPSLTWADAFATTVFAMGPRGLDWVRRFPSYTAIAINTDATIVATDGIARAA
ncbi:MAG TPA: FAD:protein FMN transferase, partial [Ilumatobacteraceae bacterium]